MVEGERLRSRRALRKMGGCGSVQRGCGAVITRAEEFLLRCHQTQDELFRFGCLAWLRGLNRSIGRGWMMLRFSFCRDLSGRICRRGFRSFWWCLRWGGLLWWDLLWRRLVCW